MEWVVNATPRSVYPRESGPVPIAQEAVWAPGPARTVAENLASTGIRFPDPQARSELLYRPRYPCPRLSDIWLIQFTNIFSLYAEAQLLPK
jgi:hypothetical protein